MTTRLQQRVTVPSAAGMGLLHNVVAARSVAQRLLSPLGSRWRHTVSVAARARELGEGVPATDRHTLVVAAWLHDIGYAPSIHDTGMHSVDGAQYLRLEGWPERICALVAHHSGARFVAPLVDLADVLGQYEFELSPVSDALTCADQTTGPYGQRMQFEDRLADMLHRHGPGSAQARAHELRAPYLREASRRASQRAS